jgi:hypothetical protein
MPPHAQPALHPLPPPHPPGGYSSGPACRSGDSTKKRRKERAVTSPGLSPWWTTYEIEVEERYLKERKN